MENRFASVLSEIANRSNRTTKLSVIDAPRQTGKERVTLPGTLTVYVGKKGTNAVDEVRSAFSKGPEQIQKLTTEIDRQIGSSHLGLETDLVRSMIREPVFADIVYGGAALNRGFFLPKGIDLFPIPLAYNGGQLAADGFTMVEHFKKGAEDSLEALIVRSGPSLTTAEKAALEMVPADQRTGNIATPDGWCDTTWWAVAVTVIGAVKIAVAITVVMAAMEEVHLSESDIEKLGPSASARELMALRQRVLSNFLVR